MKIFIVLVISLAFVYFGAHLFVYFFSYRVVYGSKDEQELPKQIVIAEVTAYNALQSQTDSSPTITASNQKVRKGIIANNCLDFGTKVALAGTEYEVQDRMNKRYDCSHFDIFMWSYQEARDFGRQTLEVIIQ